MALINTKYFFTSLLILVALFGVRVEGTVHKVGDSSGWTKTGVDYQAWARSRTFQVGDSLVFKYNNTFHDVTEVSPDDFLLCDPSNPLARYQTGSDTVTLIKLGFRHFICGVPGHCIMGQKFGILVFPASLGSVAARFQGSVISPVRSPIRSPVRSPVRSPIRSPIKSPVRSPIGSPVRSPIRSPVRSPVRSPIGSPVRSPFRSPIGSPIRSPIGSPIRSPVRSPVRSPSSFISLSLFPMAVSPTNSPQFQMGPRPL